jgi:hypothetical protein
MKTIKKIKGLLVMNKETFELELTIQLDKDTRNDFMLELGKQPLKIIERIIITDINKPFN